jgi:hypothetical protein
MYGTATGTGRLGAMLTTVSEAQLVELGILPYASQPSKNVPFRSTEKLKARRHRDNGDAILRLI